LCCAGVHQLRFSGRDSKKVRPAAPKGSFAE
jgi:hypothetical protein